MKSPVIQRLKTLQDLANTSPKTARLAALQQAANHSAAPPVQRLVDLYKKYANPKYDLHNDPQNEEKKKWLDLFTTAQKILNNPDLVNKALTRLSAQMIENNQTLADALETELRDQWGAQDTFLTGFVPAQTFLKLIRDGKLFRDYVAQAHGVHTHQIQWFIIQEFMGPETAIELFKEAGNERWKNQKYMWDWVVDETESLVDIPTDFTSPEKLEAMINNRFKDKILGIERKNDPLVRDLHETHEKQRDIRAGLRKRYPGSDLFDARMNTARNTLISDEAELKDKNEALKSVMNIVIRNTTTIDNVKMTIDWTGWIQANGENPDPFFEPTVGTRVA